MSDRNEQIIESIVHYQQCLDKYLKRNHESRILHCISKLRSMPITVAHLKQTGIGRTVNGLRRIGGVVGDAAKSLVTKWKEMVVEEEEEENDTEDNVEENKSDYVDNVENKKCKEPDNKRKDLSKTSSKRKYDNSADEETSVKHHKYLNSDEEEKDKKKHHHGHSSRHKSSAVKDMKSKEIRESKSKEGISNDIKFKKDSTDDGEKSKSKSRHTSNSDSRHRTKDDRKSKHSSTKHHTSHKHSTHDKKSKVSVGENGIGSGSGASFAEALGMVENVGSKVSKKKVISSKSSSPEESATWEESPTQETSQQETSHIEKIFSKKMEPLNLNFSNLLPEITPNYRPLGHFSVENNFKNKVSLDDEALSSLMYSKISRTKVYSGNKVIWGKVPSLFDLCTRVLQDNIDALEYTGGVPYSILKPVLERANPDQLYTLEHYNAYLTDDTDELWQLHCQKEFRNKEREEMETWRDMYMRCVDEREAKLRALTANIKLAQDKSLPVRQTKLAYVDTAVKPPRSVARKQAKNGTASDKKPLVTPSSRLSTLATAGAAGQIAVPNPGSRACATSGSSNAISKPKKAPLMQKTLAFMKNRCFRR